MRPRGLLLLGSGCTLNFSKFPNISFLLSFSPIAQVDQATPLKELFDQLTYDDMWDDAGVIDCIKYARGSKLLEIPSGWRDSMPAAL